MKDFCFSLACMAIVGTLMIGCNQFAPPPASAQEPTAVPAKKVDFPKKGNAITIIVPYSAGGNTDLAARLLAVGMEKELGTPVSVVNKPGAGSQVGLTQMANAKPDGYTLCYGVIPSAIITYLDPDRKTAYKRKDLQQVANHFILPVATAVLASSPYMTMKDFLDAARAKPDAVKVGTAGLMGTQHLTVVLLGRAAGVEFTTVHFDGGAPEVTALLGGHIDVSHNGWPEILPYVKSGQLRVLGFTGTGESRFVPGVKTYEAQGYKVNLSSYGGPLAPAGTPSEVVEILSGAAKKAMESPDHLEKMEKMGFDVKYMNPQQFAKHWDDMEAQLAPLMDVFKVK